MIRRILEKRPDALACQRTMGNLQRMKMRKKKRTRCSTKMTNMEMWKKHSVCPVLCGCIQPIYTSTHQTKSVKVLNERIVDDVESLANPKHIEKTDVMKILQAAGDDDEKEAVDAQVAKLVLLEAEKKFVELVDKHLTDASGNVIDKIIKAIFDAIARFLKEKYGWEIPTKRSEFEKIFVPPTLQKRQEPNAFEGVAPQNYEDLKTAMAEHYAQGGVKAVGTEYGWTDVAFSNGASIETAKYLTNPSVDINLELLNEYGTSTYNDGNLIQSECGCTYDELATYLWPLDKRQSLEDKATGKKYKVFKVVFFNFM